MPLFSLIKYLRFSFSLIYLFLPFLCVLSCQEIEEDIEEEKIKEDCVVIIPDIQNYTDNSSNFYYLEQIASFCSYSEDINIVANLQVGDITNNNQPWQYENAYSHFFSLFTKDRYPIFCLGNHDYGDNGKSLQRYSNIPSILFPEREIVMDSESLENYVRHINIDGKRFAVLELEFAPRTVALEWANKIIRAEPSTPFIILTHAFMNHNGLLFDATDPNCEQAGSPKSYYMGGDYINDGMEIFNNIIKNNPNVQFVVCGHSCSSNYIEYLALSNEQGKRVHCIMVNYQNYLNGGDGNVGCLLFQKNKCRLQSYSTIKRCFDEKIIEIAL